VREAPVYGVYSINIGERQKNRFIYSSVINIAGMDDEIPIHILGIIERPRGRPVVGHGAGGEGGNFCGCKNSVIYPNVIQKSVHWYRLSPNAT